MLVIACNTATSAALSPLCEAFPGIPVQGVIRPGAKAAVRATRNGCIAVLATEATIHGGAYQRAIAELDPKARVVGRACTLFVPLAEEGWMEGDVVEGVCRRYVGDLFEGESRPDTILLGCTHFPLLKGALARVVGPGVSLVDSAQTTAEAVDEYLAAAGLATPSKERGSVRFMATDNTARFARTGSLFLGRELKEEEVELVDI
jgi:glutamate racemase